LRLLWLPPREWWVVVLGHCWSSFLADY